MLKALLTVITIAGVTAIGIYGPRWLMSESGSQSGRGMIECNVLEDTCRWTNQGNHWEAHLMKIGAEAGNTEYRLSVKTNMSQPRLLAVLRGESMYLGEYPVPMTRAEMGDRHLWETRFTAPFCTTDPEMTWRIDLQTGIDREADGPMKLIFEAEGRT